MKNIYLLVFLVFISCGKSIEDNCFQDNADEAEVYKEEVPFTVQEILSHKPDYLTISKLKKYRSFKEDSISSHFYDINNEKEELRKYEDHKKYYAKFDSLFNGQFAFSSKQFLDGKEYALAKNELGFWLVKIENDKPYAYFLGLSFSHYYINEVQTDPIVKNGKLQLLGSLVQIIKVPGLPGYDDYSAIDDGRLFSIKLSDLEKDSDNDGYNDIFEESFGLNPDSEDSDSDGVDDFNDLNPLFKSEKNKFTSLFEQLLPKYATSVGQNFKKMNYYFVVYDNDCEYFQHVNPELRTIIIPEETSKRSYYLRVTDVINGGISKMKKDKKNPDKFYILKWGSSSTTDYCVEFINGKWKINITSSTVV
ncbi:hypothetical protein LUD75_08425 [Epilithonimonas sp. JDS]|uniref:hypothetical protein n=1 Tax=Epilithonimonas sp. JDS TaxID=2902797 RepID=UPI001E463DF2|nr:hypothetical protein [Epilithonimonas sp. JDS]MCD9854730.1 hypothetical protein [Epilithonimonas sp. JDS]